MYIGMKQFLILILLKVCLCKRHTILLSQDGRRNFPLSTFGFFKGGKLLVDIVNFSYAVPPGQSIRMEDLDFGFSLQRTNTDGVTSYMEKNTRTCLLEDLKAKQAKDVNLILFRFDLKKGNISIEKFGNDKFQLVKVYDEFKAQGKWNLTQWIKSHMAYLEHSIGLDSCDPDPSPTTSSSPIIQISNSSSNNQLLSFTSNSQLFQPTSNKQSSLNYSGKFTVNIDCSPQAGLYNLYFHNCFNYKYPDAVKINLELHMIEHNENTYLSAGEIPLPIIYGFMSAGFFLTACVWTVYLRRHWMWTYKIHWLMAALIFIKSISIAFHAVNFYYTGKEGFRVQSLTVLYYIIHLLKGALLFTTIVLIGTGYFFMKHVLSSKEKKLFMVVIPLQVIANVALIISESTEEGNASYKKWYEVTLLVDLLCCGAILLPVVWSIRHLSEAAKTDGKAAISLQKLKLFRQFYVLIVCYIYFTRIVVYLIKITVPFQFMWLDEFFTKTATFFFFVLTGYKFRPVNNNPYLHLPQEDEDDIEMNDISPQCGYAENLTRVNKVEPKET